MTDTPTTEPEYRGYEFLRDYLYLDIDKVKSIAGQLEFGTPEEFREIDSKKRKRTFGWDKVLSGSNEESEERYLQRSVLDSLFPELESTLEDGWLIDISEEFKGGSQNFSQIKELRPEGSIFRLRASGILFDFEYFAATLGNYSAALGGYQAFADVALPNQDAQPNLRKPSQKRTGRVDNSEKYRSLPPNPSAEDLIEEFSNLGGISPSYLRSISRLTRGISRPGTSLFMDSGDDSDAIVAAARFQQNQRYFDGDSTLVASRFGLSKQDWTIVGTIGHYTRSMSEVEGIANLTNGRGTLDAEGNFSRRYFIDMMSVLIQNFGARGLSDIPQHPGISVIPIAVYRSFERIPRRESTSS